MRVETVTRELYQFDELTNEAQQTAIENNYDINVDCDWWEFVLDDAEQIGLKIKEFDLYRRDINGELLDSIGGVCQLILDNHGDMCETYKLALKWRHRTGDDNAELFLKELLQEYLNMLGREYDYLTSEESIVDTIKVNEYEFTADGKPS